MAGHADVRIHEAANEVQLGSRLVTVSHPGPPVLAVHERFHVHLRGGGVQAMTFDPGAEAARGEQPNLVAGLLQRGPHGDGRLHVPRVPLAMMVIRVMAGRESCGGRMTRSSRPARSRRAPG